MELTTVVQRNIISLTQSRQTMGTSVSAKSTTITDERYKQQMKALDDANAFLKQVPDKKSADRKDKTEKISMLRERLKMLKQMIPFMSPSAVKSLKSELRQIASQLSSLSNDGVGGDNIDVKIPTDSNKVEDSAKTDTPEETDKAKDTVARDAKTDEQTSAREKDKDKDSSDSDKLAKIASENQQIQEEMEELKRLYRLVRVMVQRKLQQANDKGEPLPNGPPALKPYLPIPETGISLQTRA